MNRSRSSASSVASGAAALLKKARGHMRGQGFASEARGSTSLPLQKQEASRDEEEDDIAAYLSQLSKKTSSAIKKKQTFDDISSGLSDLSLSDEKGSDVKSLPQNKFLKKSASSTPVKSSASLSAPSKTEVPTQRPTSGVARKASSSFTSSALQRASKLNAKITARKKGVHVPLDSDSSDADNRGPSMGVGVALPSEYAPQVGDGNRFLKKAAASKPTEPAQKPVVAEEESDESYPIEAINARDSVDGTRAQPLTSTPLRGAGLGAGPGAGAKKGSVFTRIMAQLDTDEEDMDELIGGVSEVSSPEPHVPQAQPKPEPKAQPQQKEAKRMVTPFKQPEPASDSPSESASISKPTGLIGTTPFESMAVMDLEPVAVDLSSVRSDVHSDVPTEIDSSIAEDVSLGPTLAGLQTIDDLLPAATLNPSPDSPVNDKQSDTYQDDFESMTERTVSPIRSPSPKPILVEETDPSISTAHSVQEVSEHSRTVADSYSSISSHSRSSRTHRSKSRSRSHSTSRSSRTSDSNGRSRTPDTTRSVTSITSSRSKSTSYSEDFDSVSRSSNKAVSDDDTITSDFSTSHSQRSPRGSGRDSRKTSRRHGKESRQSHRKERGKHSGQDVAVQTSSSLHSMNRHWLKDYDFETPGYFKLLSADIRERTSQVVDPGLLQTLSSFDTTSLDLHASLAEQVRQTQLAVTNTLRQHRAFLESLEENYAYTTLEDTKLFIKTQKKRRRKREEEADLALQELDMNVDD